MVRISVRSWAPQNYSAAGNIYRRAVRFLGASAKLWKATISFVVSVCLSVRPHGTTWLLLSEILWNLIFEYFPKICSEISSFIKIEHVKRILTVTVTTLTRWWLYIVEFFVEGEMFKTNSAEQIKAQVVQSFFFLNSAFYDTMWKHIVQPEATDDKYGACAWNPG